jgi:hypothetical protein
MALPSERDRKLYYTVPETAMLIDRSLGLVRRWIFRGQLQGVVIADEILVPADAVEERVERLARRRARHALRAGDSTARSR